ncbi:MAG: CBS domain-containing protein [Firmicutes bacterium]|nr:CBS domain-containing protein [Bacillota bacterium]
MGYTASSVMNTSIVSIGPEATLGEVVEVLAENGISGLPVIDSNNKAVGIITETDIIGFTSKTHVVPLIGTSGWISPHMDVTKTAEFKKGFTLLKNTKVEKVMSKKPITATEDMHIHEVAGLMERKKVNRVLVVDKENKVVGIIARADLVNFLAKWKR